MRFGHGLTFALDTDTVAAWTPDAPQASPEAAAAPAIGPSAPAGLGQELYLRETGDSSAISIDDIHQGGIGDCFLLAAVGELALTHADAIQAMIHANANDTETVTVYGAHSANQPFLLQTRYDPHAVTVTNLFPANAVNAGAGQDVVGNTKEIWPSVLEKALAMASGGYATINFGGYPAVVMAELTGHSPLRFTASAVSADMLASFSAAKDLIVFDTPVSANLPDNLVGNHAYMFEGLVGKGTAASVQLGNPWGYDQPSLIPVAQLGRAVAEIDIGRVG